MKTAVALFRFLTLCTVLFVGVPLFAQDAETSDFQGTMGDAAESASEAADFPTAADSGGRDAFAEIGATQESALTDDPASGADPFGGFDFGGGGDGPGAPLSVTSEGQLAFDENVAYGLGRTTVVFGDMTIAADRMAIDVITRTVTAEGNVTVTGEKQDIRASRARYDFRLNEGVAYDVEGVYGPFFFRSIWDEEENGPSFRRVSEDEALFRGASFTTSTFPVPTYYITASEVLIYMDDRIFIKNATFWVWANPAIPLFWLPVYTVGFDGGSPWSFSAGYRSRYGAFLSVGYDVSHESKVPAWDDPDQMNVRSSGKLGVRTDLFSGGAVGVGAKYRYRFDFKRHIGSLELYGVRDSVRDVDGETDEERWLYRHRHNTLFGNTLFQLNADWMSDPDLYFDLLDGAGADSVSVDVAAQADTALEDAERGRVPERRLRSAIAYVKDDYVARLTGEIKDRVTRDRYQDFTDPDDDNLNYEPDLDFDDEDDDTEGIPSSRYGRVTERLHGRVATRMLPLLRTPLFWRAEVNGFNALDAGFNEGDTEDDERIYGGDVYGALSHRLRLDPQGRFTWLNQVGAGAGAYERTSDALISRKKLADFRGVMGADPRDVRVDGQRYRNASTIYLGEGDNRLDYEDVDPFFLWADYTSRLNARFTDTLSGYVQYYVRQLSNDSAGTFFEEAGRKEAFQDIYDFPTREHYVESRLDYRLLYPNLGMYVFGRYNLQDDNEIFANEPAWQTGTGFDYLNDSGEFGIAGGVGVDEFQLRDPGDPNEYRRSNAYANLRTSYTPIHNRYYAGLNIGGNKILEDDPADDPPEEEENRFDEDDSEFTIEPVIGKRFGPKYLVEVGAEYNSDIDDFKEAGVTIERELPDFVLAFFFGFKLNTFEDRDELNDRDRDERDGDRELDFRVSARFKQPGERGELSAVSVTTLRERQRRAEFAE
ncbi:MAG: hypothetical protein RLY93_11345 [Sumerlaeia bacterium]